MFTLKCPYVCVYIEVPLCVCLHWSALVCITMCALKCPNVYVYIKVPLCLCLHWSVNMCMFTLKCPYVYVYTIPRDSRTTISVNTTFGTHLELRREITGVDTEEVFCKYVHFSFFLHLIDFIFYLVLHFICIHISKLLSFLKWMHLICSLLSCKSGNLKISS